MTEAEEHFDQIAKEYDFWKSKNHYYYDSLKALFRSRIPVGASVLEIGCGTGDLLAALKPSAGRGTDVSAAMISLAKAKHADRVDLCFEREDIFETDQPWPEGHIFLADVLEHVPDARAFSAQLAMRVSAGTKVIVSLANPLWEPILMAAEKLGLKMPEGPHKRYSIGEMNRMFETAGFRIDEFGYRLLVPKRIWGGEALNRWFHRVPGLRRLGFVVFWVLGK